jgi:hypothetical protein
VNRLPIEVTRWRAVPLPQTFGSQNGPRFAYEENVFQYPDAENTSPNEVHWYVFAYSNSIHHNIFLAVSGRFLC